MLFNYQKPQNERTLEKASWLFCYYDQKISSILLYKSPYIFIKWNICVCLLQGSCLYKVNQTSLRACWKAEQLRKGIMKKTKPYTLDLTTFWLSVDIKPVCILITRLKRVVYVTCSCWQDRNASSDPLDAWGLVRTPSAALPLAACSRMLVGLMVTHCCPRAPALRISPSGQVCTDIRLLCNY